MKKSVLLLLTGFFLVSGIFAGGSRRSKSSGKSLLIYDQFYRDVESEVMEAIIAAYEEENPGVTIERETQTLDDLKLGLKMTVESGNGPDIFNLNQGEADMGAFVADGLAMDITEEAKSRGWEEVFGAPMMRLMGYKGSYYGISVTSEIVGIYYNKEIFGALGAEVPATLDAFDALLAQAKEAGYVPIAFGNSEGWNGIHEWSAIQHVMASREDLDAMMSGETGDFWNNPANISAAQKLQEWAQNGYFTENFSGIGSDDSVSIFMQGESAMTLHGNWYQGEISANAPFEVGFFPLPANSPELLKAVGGPGIPFAISAKTEKKEEALKFLDMFAREEVAKMWAGKDMFPALPVDLTSHSDNLFAEIAGAYTEVGNAGGIGYFIDWISPTFYDTSANAITELLAGAVTPEEFTAKLQEDYSANY